MSNVAAAAAPQPASQSASQGPTLWAHGSFSFKDLLDIVNPLQHLPVVGSIYRYLTGDEPSGGARIVGDSIYGGPIGFGVSVVTTALLTDSSGKDLGERMLADVFGPRDGGTTPATTAVAAASVAPAATKVAAAVPATQLTAAIPQPVAMNQLFHSPPPAAPTSPEQTFLAQNAQFQRQLSNGRGSNGQVLNDHPVPLELSSNLVPVLPPGARLVTPTSSQASVTPPAPIPPAPIPSAPTQVQAQPASAAAAATNPLAQKMLEALDKYEQLKKQQEQEDSVPTGGTPRVDLAL